MGTPFRTPLLFFKVFVPHQIWKNIFLTWDHFWVTTAQEAGLESLFPFFLIMSRDLTYVFSIKLSSVFNLRFIYLAYLTVGLASLNYVMRIEACFHNNSSVDQHVLLVCLYSIIIMSAQLFSLAISFQESVNIVYVVLHIIVYAALNSRIINNNHISN